MRFMTSALAVVAVSGATWAPSNAWALTPGVAYDVLAITGGDAPGTGGLVFGGSITPPLLSNNGVYAFRAGVIGEGTDGVDPALFVMTRDGVQYLGREGGLARELPGIVNSGLGFSDINPSGVLVYRAFLDGPGTTFENGVAVYHGLPDALRLVARGGEPAPGGTEGETWRPGRFLIDAAGNAVVSGAMGGGDAVWAGPVDALTLVARQGGATPSPGITYGYISDVTELAPSGTFVLSTSEATSSRRMYFVGTPGNLARLAGEQDAAPGLPGFILDAVADAQVNSSAESIFLARLGGPGISDVNDDALIAGTPGNLRVVARAGEPAPGTDLRFSGETDTEYDFIPDFGQSLQINDRGTVAFTARLARPSPGGSDVGTFLHEWGIWAGDPDDLRPVVRNGQRAPGTEEGVYFGARPKGYDHDVFPFNAVLLNENDQLAFISLLKGSDRPLDAGLFVTDLSGDVQLVARIGDVLTIDGVDREILNFSLGGDRSFNEVGQIGLVVRFVDGTTASIVATVPEPGACGAMVMGVGVVMRRRRHARWTGDKRSR